tara:strand:+ start:4274 stop:4642 length:369 start_codon:yes stop_codon:yes gene_type:complete
MTKRVTSKDIEIAFLLNQVDGVKALFPKGKKAPSKKVFQTAIAALDKNGIEVAQLSELNAQLHPNSGAGRGKTQPVVGETREYSVQKVKNSAPFIRLPLSTLNVDRGTLVTVQFKDGAIVVG